MLAVSPDRNHAMDDQSGIAHRYLIDLTKRARRARSRWARNRRHRRSDDGETLWVSARGSDMPLCSTRRRWKFARIATGRFPCG